MSREDYDREARRLLENFRAACNDNGPPGGNYDSRAQELSLKISQLAAEFDPAWYPLPNVLKNYKADRSVFDPQKDTA